MKSSVFVKLSMLFFVLLTSSYSHAQSEFPQVTVEGLQLINSSELAVVYALPDADLGQYSKIYLLDTKVSFKKNWRRDQNRNKVYKVKASEMASMKLELAELFQQVFMEVLRDGGYQLVTSPGDDVLLIKPAIINLDIVAADTMSASNVRTYSETAGEMTLYLELYDSVSNQLIAKALDQQKDRRTGYFQWQNRVTNRAAARRIIKVWADVLKQGLDQARGVTTR